MIHWSRRRRSRLGNVSDRFTVEAGYLALGQHTAACLMQCPGAFRLSAALLRHELAECISQKCLEDPQVGTKDSPANKRLHDVVAMARKSWTLKVRSLQRQRKFVGVTSHSVQ